MIINGKYQIQVIYKAIVEYTVSNIVLARDLTIELK